MSEYPRFPHLQLKNFQIPLTAVPACLDNLSRCFTILLFLFQPPTCKSILSSLNQFTGFSLFYSFPFLTLPFLLIFIIFFSSCTFLSFYVCIFSFPSFSVLPTVLQTPIPTQLFFHILLQLMVICTPFPLPLTLVIDLLKTPQHTTSHFTPL